MLFPNSVFATRFVADTKTEKAKTQPQKAVETTSKPFYFAQRLFDFAFCQFLFFKIQNQVFEFSPEKGRIPPVVASTSENPTDQLDCFINIYKATLLGGRIRIGYARCKLKDILNFEQGNARVPHFLAIKPIVATDNYVEHGASVLLTLEKYHTDDIARHARKRVSYQNYVLRSYIYMARHVSFEQFDNNLPNLCVSVSCAGSAKTTFIEENNVRPTWMQMLEMRITLLTGILQFLFFFVISRAKKSKICVSNRQKLFFEARFRV